MKFIGKVKAVGKKIGAGCKKVCRSVCLATGTAVVFMVVVSDAALKQVKNSLNLD